jgi:CheY-like chemotaxis protein
MTDRPGSPESVNGDALGLLEGACILLVEDDPASAKLEAIVLRQAKCHVQVTPNASSAAALLLAGLRPAVILVDLHLPDMSGLDFARFVRACKVTAGIPIVAVTSSAPHYREAEIRAAGCDGFIHKPIDTDVFPAMVASHIRSDSQA